jgi:large subunit ribosomal protein L7e
MSKAPKKTDLKVEKSKEPEGFAKKRERDAKLTAQREADTKTRTANLQARVAEYKKRAETRRAELIKAQKDVVAAKRKARAEGGFYVPADAKVALVVRIRGINRLSPIVRQILCLFRLRQLHNAALVKINKATINMLRRVEPYIAYGFPTRKTISDLVLKRGFARINKQRIPINNNEIIEQHLGKHGIVCADDLIHELATCGPKFKEANTFMWYFKLSPPKGGFVHKRHPFQNGGDWGNREELINELVQRMV